MTAAYTLLDANAPAGTQSPAAFSISALANVRALRDAVVCGFVPGFSYSWNGGTLYTPTNRVWANASTGIRFRLVSLTWHGTMTWVPLTVRWEWSDDNGATWANMDATAATITWDTTNGYLVMTSVDRDAGLWCFALNGMLGAIASNWATLNHAQLAATSAHSGLGTMAAQNANAVAVSGGNIDNTSFGASTRGLVNATRVSEGLYGYAPGANAGVVVSWANGGSYITNSGTNNVTMSNVPAGAAGHMLYVSNLNATTFTGVNMNWGLGGKPSIAGACFITLITYDAGATIYASIAWRAV